MRVEFVIAGVPFILDVDGLGDGPIAHLRDLKLKPFLVEHVGGARPIQVRARMIEGSGPFAGHEPVVERDDRGLVSFAHRTSLLERLGAVGDDGTDGFQLTFGYDDARPIENALRVLVSERLRSEGGGLFHSAAIAHGGRGWLFPGVSGAGKTTLSLRAGRRLVLSDEMPAVTRRVKGQGGVEWMVAATPFFGDMGHGERGDSLPLAGVCLLGEKGVKSFRRAGAAKALQGLLATVVLYGPEGQSQREAATVAQELATTVPVWELSTELEEPFAEVIERVERVAFAS